MREAEHQKGVVLLWIPHRTSSEGINFYERIKKTRKTYENLIQSLCL